MQFIWNFILTRDAQVLKDANLAIACFEEACSRNLCPVHAIELLSKY